VKKRVELDHFKYFQFPNTVKVGPDGTVTFTVKRVSMDDNKYYSDLYMFRDGKTVRLTSSGAVSGYYWLGDSIVFPDIRLKKDKEYTEKKLPLTVLQRLRLGEGEAEELLRIKMDVTDIKFVSESDFYFTAGYDPMTAKLPEDEDAAAKALKEEADYAVFDEIPFWQNGVGITNKKRNRLYHYRDGQIEALTDELTDVYDFRFAGESGRLLYIANRFENKMETRNWLYLYDMQSGRTEDISFSKEPYQHSHVIPLGGTKLLVQGSDLKKYGLNQIADFYIYDYKSGAKTAIDTSCSHTTGCSVGSDLKMGTHGDDEWPVDSEGRFYFIETCHGESQVSRIDLKAEKIERVTSTPGAVLEIEGKGDALVAVAMRGNGGPELYEIALDGSEKRLTELNAHLLDEYEYSTPEVINYKNKDGIEIEGWYIKPLDFDAKKKYPVVLDVHGGPMTVYGTSVFHEMQYWAAQGYAVIFCNPRGSDGRGADFADIRGKYGTIDYDDIMGFVDHCLAELPWLDGDRMCETGGSYGGFMSNWIIGHTDRFKAVASQRSISNWISKSNTTDIGYYFNQDQTQANAWDNVDKAWWHSPLKYANRAKTPTLFIHSDEDYRCWMAEGIQMYTALKVFGIEARLVLFHGENHELSRSGAPKHRVRRLDEITKWFDKHVMPGKAAASAK